MGMFFLEERSLLLFIKFKLLEKKTYLSILFKEFKGAPNIYIFIYLVFVSHSWQPAYHEKNYAEAENE